MSADVSRHLAETAIGGIATASFWWLPLLDDGIRYSTGALGLVYLVLKIIQIKRDLRKGK